MDSFQGTNSITVQPSTDAVPYTFTFKACTTATANDGSLPFSTTIASITVKAFTVAGTEDAELVESSSVLTPVVTATLTYPTTNGAGRDSLEFVLTLNTGAVMEFDYTRVFVKDISA